MDRYTPTAPVLSPKSGPQPAPSPGRRRTGAAVEPACGIATAAVAVAFGLARLNLDTSRRHARQATLARQVAMYLAHVGLGIPMADIGRAFRRHRTTVTHACHVVEDRRDDPRFDRLLDSLEAAAAALRAAYQIHHQR